MITPSPQLTKSTLTHQSDEVDFGVRRRVVFEVVVGSKGLAGQGGGESARV